MKNLHDHVLDEWLVLRYQSGDKKALGLLYDRWNKRLVKQAYWYTYNTQMALDIAQDVWIVIMRNLHKLNDASKFSGWVLTITSRKAIDWVRKQEKERTGNKELIYESTVLELEDDSPDEKIERIRKAIRELDTNLRIVVTLYYLEERSVKGISMILSIAEGTVKSRLFHAREKLKETLKRKYYENE